MDYAKFKAAIRTAGEVEKAIGELIVSRCNDPDDAQNSLIMRFLVVGTMARKYKEMCKLSPTDAVFCEMMLDTMEEALDAMEAVDK